MIKRYILIIMKLFVYFLIIMVAIHIYLHFIVHPENYLSTLKDTTREEITDTVYYKLPFFFNGSDILQPLHIKEYTKITKRTYDKPYETITLLEPYVKFFPKDMVYTLKKNKFLPMHSNLECRNFYIIHKGFVMVHAIHPKYKDILPEKIENNSKVLHVSLTEKEIIFIPNYWGVYIKAMEDTVIEKVQYKTIMNQSNFIWDYLTNLNISSYV